MTTTVTEPRVRSLAVATGLRLTVRAIAAGDRDAQSVLLTRMSEASRHMRFLTSKTDFSPRELAYFTDIDHLCHEALVAIDERDGSMVAVARYVWIDDWPRTSEVAGEVVDDLHGLGIGTALAELTVMRAHDNGFELLRATTLSDNDRGRALLRRLGFRPTRRSGREIEFTLALD